MDDIDVIETIDEEQWRFDLKVGLADIKAKHEVYPAYWAYYNGDHPKRWLTDDIEHVFDKHLALNMSENWCKLAINAPIKRLRVDGWQGAESVVAQITAISKENHLGLLRREIYRRARVTGEAFVCVWPSAEKDSGYVISVQEESCISWQPSEARSNPTCVTQLFTERTFEGEVWRVTLYYRDTQLRLIGPRVTEYSNLPSARYFRIDEDSSGGEHGFDENPVIKYTYSEGSVIKDGKNTQDRMNKLESNKMVASEWGAFRRLAILTTQAINLEDSQMRPNKALILDPGESGTSGSGGSSAPTSIWEGTATELANYDNSHSAELDKFFTLMTLPRHMRVNPGVAPSGDAIEADEGPFLESIEDMQAEFGESEKDIWRVIFGKEATVDLEPIWHDPRPRSDKDKLQAVKMAVESGMPLEMAARKYLGWDEDDLHELMQLIGEQSQENVFYMPETGTPPSPQESPVPTKTQLLPGYPNGGGNNG